MFDVSEVRYEVGGDEHLVVIRALYSRTPIGHVHCFKQGNRFGIGDLFVEPELPRARRCLLRRLIPLPDRRRPVLLRRRGIGRELLTLALRESDKPEIEVVWGSITQDDLDRCPFLLEMYERRGFTVQEPDSECVQNAVKKIVRRRSD